MQRGECVRQVTSGTIELSGKKLDYRLVNSKSARKLRVRVGVEGVEALKPVHRELQELEAFLRQNQEWILNQLKRVERFRSVWKPRVTGECEILYRGVATAVRIEEKARREGTNKVVFENNTLNIVRGSKSRTSSARSLENWLRKKARQEIYAQLAGLTEKLGKHPCKVYVMGQKTKWGSCSSLQNLSFNWRLIMAPDFVLRYIVTHEAVHLKVPDHSRRFWLTVQSLCPETDQARQWLCANSDRMMKGMHQVGVILGSKQARNAFVSVGQSVSIQHK